MNRPLATAPDPPQPCPYGPEAEAVIAEVLDHLARAIVADLEGDTTKDGRTPRGDEP